MKKLIRPASAILALLLAGVMTAQVFMRYVFDLPFLGIEEIAVLFAQWVYFTGAALASSENDHIGGGFQELLPEASKWRRPARLVSTAVSVIVASICLYFAIDYLNYRISTGRTSPYLEWPSGLWVAAPVFGFGLMCVYEFRNFWHKGPDQ